MRIVVLTLGLANVAMLMADATDIQKVKQKYEASYAAIGELKTPKDVERLIDIFQVPEWVGTFPAGETLTRESSVAEGVSILSIPPEKRPRPNIQFVYVTETGWNILAVYWQYRKDGEKIVGSLFRDTWVRAEAGWRRVRTEKFFPDRTLVEGGKGVILPGQQVAVYLTSRISSMGFFVSVGTVASLEG
jgi:hypothetical protein